MRKFADDAHIRSDHGSSARKFVKKCSILFYFQFMFVATEQNDFYRHELDWEMCSIHCLPLPRCIMESRKMSRTEWMKCKKGRGKKTLDKITSRESHDFHAYRMHVCHTVFVASSIRRHWSEVVFMFGCIVKGSISQVYVYYNVRSLFLPLASSLGCLLGEFQLREIIKEFR